jgi:Holliday junction resolvasome RuvABC endonuclease subunit
MEIVRVLGIDPSLRNTGFAILSYNLETKELTTSKCGVLKTVSTKHKGLDGVKEMLNRITELSTIEGFFDVDDVVVEFPMYFFNADFANYPLLAVAGIAGGAASIFGTSRTLLVTPSEWNQRKKKEVNQKKTEASLGEITTWNFLSKPKKGDLEHIYDAAGMALWFINIKYAQAF